MASYPDQRCVLCGVRYVAHTTAALYCGGACKTRAFRARRSVERRLRAFDDAARDLPPADLRHLVSEAQRLLAASPSPRSE